MKFVLFIGDDPTKLTHDGFNDWKNAEMILCSHERSQNHRKNTFVYIQRLSKLMKIDKDIKSQFEKEKVYWKSLVQRLIHIIKFLASRGLPFHGRNENLGSVQNGNYLGLIELLAEYNVFLKNHLQKYGNPGRGYTSYLSHGIRDRFVTFIPIRSHKATSMETTIIEFLKKSGIQLNKCRGQCYDNASNMSGIYNGLQALIKN